nr:uncharacterized protein LOC109185906 [Ipomoea batatas]
MNLWPLLLRALEAGENEGSHEPSFMSASLQIRFRVLDYYDFKKIVTDDLLALGYIASICKSKWEKASSIPTGEYEYIDVIVEGERVLIDVDFRLEFEIARLPMGSYKMILQLLPFIFVFSG